ncbi:hypothetical protein LNQ52_13190 [Klebsiella pneumoniae subsp. pneumoniae]|nr:hypothetical protein [Klebsiella pneumoniae subsp. pneumoniae]
MPSRAFAGKPSLRKTVLHDLGAFALTSPDSQAMGRVGEVILAPQVAHRDEGAARSAGGGDRG